MRYIGNKTKLLHFIGSVLDGLPVTGGKAADLFSGTASVGQYLKTRGFAVDSCDTMSYSYVFQKAYIELDVVPQFKRLLQCDSELPATFASRAFDEEAIARYGGQGDLFGGDSQYAALERVLLFLDTFLKPAASFVSQHYSALEEGDPVGERMFFTRQNANRIDAIRLTIEQWFSQDLIDIGERYLLLACLLEAADSVANTTGVYAAYVKTWQPNAIRPLHLALPPLVTGTGLHCRAHCKDANVLIRQLEGLDVLYLDPPYNTRQYNSYYHVPELIAEGWFDSQPELRGKTGLLSDSHKKSRWSIAGSCVDAFRDLIRHADARFVLMSYSSEGIIPETVIAETFERFGRPGSYCVHAMDYARYRADSDHDQRNYKADRVTEYVYAVELLPLSLRGAQDQPPEHLVGRPSDPQAQ